MANLLCFRLENDFYFGKFAVKSFRIFVFNNYVSNWEKRKQIVYFGEEGNFLRMSFRMSVCVSVCVSVCQNTVPDMFSRTFDPIITTGVLL